MPRAVSRAGAARLQRSTRCITNAGTRSNCLECAAIFGHLPLTIRCRLGDHTRAMMIRRILTICADVTAGAAWASLAQAQSDPVQSYPLPRGATYSPYPPNGAPADYRRAPGV